MSTTNVTLEDLMAALTPKGLPDPILYQYYKNLENRRIIINEQIGDGLMESAVLPFMEMDNDGTGEPIEILISTIGGEIYNGFSLVDQIEKRNPQ